MHLADPIAQAVRDQRRTTGWLALSVLPVAVVGVMGAVRFEDVVSLVLEAAKTQRRTGLAAFGGVVEHNIEDHFDAGAMQRLDEVAKLVERAEGILARTRTPDAAQRKKSAHSPSS